MSRYDYLASDSSLRATLDCCHVDELKKLVALLPGVRMKAPRKGELVGALERFLLGAGAAQLLAQLKALEQSAVAETVPSHEGTFEAKTLHSQFGRLWQRTGERGLVVPLDKEKGAHLRTVLKTCSRGTGIAVGLVTKHPSCHAAEQ